MNGWLVGHYVTPPDPITGSQYDQIVKYCTSVGTGNGNSLPSPFNGLVPESYKNGTYAVYVCKVK